MSLGLTDENFISNYVIAEVKDITLYDDEIFPAIIVETKSPDVSLTSDHEKQLRDYLEEVGSARYGVLTNWHQFVLYEYGIQVGWKRIANINVDGVIQKGSSKLSPNERRQILELRRYYRQIPILKDKEEGDIKEPLSSSNH